MSGENNGNCKLPKGPPVFIFSSPTVQTAANNVYTAKQVYDTNPVNIAAKRTYTFKSDYERMQYKLGLYGLTSTGQA